MMSNFFDELYDANVVLASAIKSTLDLCPEGSINKKSLNKVSGFVSEYLAQVSDMEFNAFSAEGDMYLATKELASAILAMTQRLANEGMEEV